MTAAPARVSEITKEDATSALSEAVSLVQKWLYLPDVSPVYAVLGAVAANSLEGDPVWLGLVAPPSSAKTEILNAVLSLPHIHVASTITPASLLSGTSQRERVVGAKGGLLREIGDFGILVLKDFGSVLSLRPEQKAEVLAALREIYDGSWTRRLGTDGGQSLTWDGKVGLLFGVTPALDSHHGVVSTMGERFLLCRIPEAGRQQAARALDHSGHQTAVMRGELAQAVSSVFASARTDPAKPSQQERERLTDIATLATRMRSAVERDRFSREIESVPGAEGPARLALALERLLAGLDTIGCDRDMAFMIVERVAHDSVPPLRRRAFDWLNAHREQAETTAVADALGLPKNTVRRVLEDLSAYGLVSRRSHGDGRKDFWRISWGRDG